MVIAQAINLLQGLIIFFEEYISTRFEAAKSEAEKIASEMDIEVAFRETRVRHKKKILMKMHDEPIQGAEECFRVNYFLLLVDNALSSLKARFEQFKKYEEIFGFLFNLEQLKDADDESLKSSCATLENVLKHEDNYDICAHDLFSELQLLRKTFPSRLTRPIEVLEFIKNLRHGFPNAWVAYRILLTIPVTVASAERSFSKLKLIKNYLRSTMSQDRLNGFAMLSIEKKMVAELEYSTLIDIFAQ